MCNLASIAVNMFVRNDKTFDFENLKEITKVRYKFRFYFVISPILSFLFLYSVNSVTLL